MPGGIDKSLKMFVSSKVMGDKKKAKDFCNPMYIFMNKAAYYQDF